MSNAHEFATDPVAASISKARVWEASIQAWVELPVEPKLPSTSGLMLAGIPFAVKDIIDVAGLPTRLGSPVFVEALPAETDAPVVAALRAAGAVPIGKTTSTEFASVDPTKTRNPHDLNRTPGGSSSGSGAVVGAGIVPFALGSQTAGSLNRPAAYCGAFAYKPSLGLLPMEGIAPMSRSFDMVGPIAMSTDILIQVYQAWAVAFALPVLPIDRLSQSGLLRIGLVMLPGLTPEASMLDAVNDTVERFRAAGHEVQSVTPAASVAEIIDQHRCILEFEAARDILPLVGTQRNRLGPKISAALAAGEKHTAEQVSGALQWLEDTRRSFWDSLEGFDLLLACPVAGPAPVGLQSTGDPAFLTPWTAMGGPLVSLPAGRTADGAPLGLMLAMPPGSDADLLVLAARLAPLMAQVPLPTIPSG